MNRYGWISSNRPKGKTEEIKAVGTRRHPLMTFPSASADTIVRRELSLFRGHAHRGPFDAAGHSKSLFINLRLVARPGPVYSVKELVIVLVGRWSGQQALQPSNK
ncbi:hypothetical protein CBL_02525 [Carabus blaptoides fortunei]